MEITIKLPELGEGVDNVDVVEVLVSVGESIEEDQGLIEVETEKASVEVPSTSAGTVSEVHVSVGDVLGEAAPIVTIEAAEGQRGKAAEEREEKRETGENEKQEEAPVVESAPPPTPHPEVTPREGMKIVPAAPTVRRFAREIGVDLSIVSGTGAGGRISIDDVKAHGKRLLSEPAPGSASLATAELPDLARFGPVRREPMSKVRRLTAENLTRAWLTAPQVTNHEIADITDLEKFRKAYKERVESAGGKLTMTAILVKIVASVLRHHPTLNAAVDMVNHEIVFRESINIGVAVDTERGLLVPVIRDADSKDLTEIAVELDDLARRAREKKLMPDHMQGGTFSISNLGGIGGTGFSPIVNWPEVAILGISRARIDPEWYDDAFRPRLMMPLSLSYDHRLVDGADAARFLAGLKDALEQPLLLALDG
jgi:pyruvate dehydrogenase E2 component (dihydrolipoamide acetyltransferase)